MSDAQDSATERPPSAGPASVGTPSAGPTSVGTPSVVLPNAGLSPAEENPYQEKVDATYVEGTTSSESAEAYRARHRDLEGAGRWVRFVRSGGMGAVMEVAGEDRGDGSGLQEGERRFALKMVKESLLSRSAVVDRFRRELRSHRRLTVDLMATRLVPCIAVLEGHDPSPDEASVDAVAEAATDTLPKELSGLFPFFPEGSLESCLQKGISKAEALFIVVDAVEGLQSLHGHRYVHRDFHPSNILVELEGGRRRGMLGDLGVGMFWEANTIFSAERVEEDREHRVGHPGYIDPYVRASPHADLYSVGVTLFFILTGAVPPSVPAGPLRLPPSSEMSPALRQLADEVLAKMTSPMMDERFASAREARSGVVRLAELLPPATSPTVDPARASAVVSAVVSQEAPRPRSEVNRGTGRPSPTVSGRGWRRLAVVPLAGLVFAALGYGGWQLVERRPVEIPLESAAFGVETDLLPTQPADSSNLTEAPVETKKSLEPPPPEAGLPVTDKPVLTKPVLTKPVLTKPEDTRPVDTKAVDTKAVDTELVDTPDRRLRKATPLPTPHRPPPTRLTPKDLREVDQALRNGRYDRAQRLLEELRTSHPADPEVASRLASLFLRDREVGPGLARRILTTAVAAHPERGDLRHFLARVLHQIGQNGEALNLLRQAPVDSTFIREITDLQVTLERAADPQ